VDIVRIEAPTVEELSAAFEVCKLRFPYLGPLHTRARFEAFQSLGVELFAAKEGEQLAGTCFVLPCDFQLGGETLRWVCPFQLAARPEAKNIGGLLFLRISNAYPAIVTMGITQEAKHFYRVLGWKRYDDLWRGVHPVRLDRMVEDLEYRIGEGWQRRVLRAMAGVYNAAGVLVERGLSLGVSRDERGQSTSRGCPASRKKEQVIASYQDVFAVGPSLRCANVGGFGRVLNSFREGAGGVRQHACMWSDLRRQGARVCELLIGSTRARRHAVRLGYLPIHMPMFYVDRNGTVEKLIRALRRDEVSFLHTDKTV